MKRLKMIAASGLMAAILVVGQVSHAFAATIGYVDMDKIAKSYEKAQQFFSDVNVRRADLSKTEADYTKQLEDAKKNNTKNPVAVGQMEKDLSAKLNAKAQELQDWITSRKKEIQTALDTSITSAAKARNVDIVVDKQVVLTGGIDITNDVLSRLNKMP